MKLNFVEPTPSDVATVRALVPRGKVNATQISRYVSAPLRVRALAHAELTGRAESSGPGPSIAFLTVGITLLAGFAYNVLNRALDIITGGGSADTPAGKEFVNNAVISYALFLVAVIGAFAALFIWKAVSDGRSVRAKSRLDAYESESASDSATTPSNLGVVNSTASVAV
ncbi:hypothetical protein [Cryobacterium sp. 5B3]|uniref:hypothetical protein n=1 Tax=Cryobacterium sp. 5B3 TaxID=3048586 RepID=UPI002AB3AADF|nr:hypothetical protein [Cryobacterium sp. 5B3]MDY7541831.1 hypothetical protein [Cryobacterium sp. 5B3]MEB0274239.1 hypothetical protein [Cryobacterium sp. 5B3]